MTNKTISVDELLNEIDKHERLVMDGVIMDSSAKAYITAHDHIKQVVKRMDPIGTAYATWVASEDGNRQFWFCSACGRVETDKARYCRMCGARMEGDT